MMNALEFRFAFHARDFERAMAFYRDLLEMPQVGGWDHPDGRGALLSTGRGGVIEVFGTAAGKTTDGLSPAGLNLALRVADARTVDAWYHKLSLRGAQIAEVPADRPWGHRSFVVLDPDGIPVHIYCELEARGHA
jgi:lactoylglutathione lyase